MARTVSLPVDVEMILPLRGLTGARSVVAGAKAAKLGDLVRAGFPVPEGFVVTTAALKYFLEANGLGSRSTPEAIATAPLPEDLAAALRVALAPYAMAPFAVRSSAVAEDLAGASFAGQYETLLDVRGPDALLDAIRRCWASAFSARVAAYRDAKAAPDDSPQSAALGSRAMAVLVQRMVAADAAGVAFTANPVTGDRAETVVSAVRGLGERLVSGQASPDEWVMRGEVVSCLSAPEQAVDALQVARIAELARRVERHFGAPQDIEWAIEGDKLYLLQARPITTLSNIAVAPISIQPPAGYWERVADHYPQPLSPMHRSIWLPIINSGFKQTSDEFGMLASVEQREIGGWVYMRLAPLGGKDMPTPPAWMMRLLIKIVPAIRARLKQAVAAIRDDKPGQLLRRWHAEWLPTLVARIERLRAVDLGALDNTALAGHLDETIELLRQGNDIHLLLHSVNALTLADLVFTCRDLLSWDEAQTFQLLAGLSGKSTEPAARLADLARLAGERPAARAVLDSLDETAADRLPAADPEFAAAFEAYQREYGCRALRYEVAELTVAEKPAMVLALVRDQLTHSYDPAADAAALEQQRRAAADQVRAALSGRQAELSRFERALTRAEQGYPLREENEFYTISAPMALVRYALLEAGRRLAERGQIDARDEVFFLELEEARAALRSGADQRALIAQRRAERSWVERHPGPSAYGKAPGDPPPLDILPGEVRFAMEALLWSAGHIFAVEQSHRQQERGATLRGIAAAAGRYTGPVRVIADESEFDKIKPGDVLVCPITSPVWSVLFSSVGALITDTGGMLSHSAIIAREYRIPAVVATGNATRLLRDGQIVTVDGNAGIVELEL